MVCPNCGGELLVLGILGNLRHMRCRQCGMELHQSSDENDPIKRMIEQGRAEFVQEQDDMPCGGDHQAHEDCMNCTHCGQCTESLNEEGECSKCVKITTLYFYTHDGIVGFTLTDDELTKVRDMLYFCDKCIGYHVKPDGHANALALGEVLASVASRKEVEW